MLLNETTKVDPGALILIRQHILEDVNPNYLKDDPDQGHQLKKENLVRLVPPHHRLLHRMPGRNQDDHVQRQVYHYPQQMEKTTLKFVKIKIACRRSGNTAITENHLLAAHWRKLHQEGKKYEDSIRVADLPEDVVRLEVVDEIDRVRRCANVHVHAVDLVHA